MSKMMTVSWLLETFSATFAPAGTGKLPTAPPTRIVRVSKLAEAEAEAEAEDPLRLEAAGLVVVVLTVVVPAVHAASDRLAAQAARVTAAGRYLFMVSLGGVCVTADAAPGSTAPNLDGRLAGRIAYLSQTCNIVRNSGSVSPDGPLPGRAVPAGSRNGAAGHPARSATLV